jgi:small subunit ribosomal protein S2
MKFSLKSLLKVGSFIGRNKLYKSSSMSGFIFGYRSNICIIDIHQTEFMLRRALDFYIDVVSNRGKAFFISFLLKRRKPFFGQQYSRFWVNGNITNMEQLKHYVGGYKISRFLPSVVFLFQENKSKYFIMNECFRLKVPMVALTNTDMIPSMTFFPIPSNNERQVVISFYMKLFNRAFKMGVIRSRVNGYDNIRYHNRNYSQN